MNFPTIINAVKPLKRTDQYKVLAAMCCLNAQAIPVTTKQVSDLLGLHFLSKSPQNISDRLRKYSAYVEPLATKPLKWRLTTEGLNHLRALSGLPIPNDKGTADFESDIGIICAIDEPELTAVARACGTNAWKEVGSTRYAHIYHETTLVTKTGTNLKLIATNSTTMGLTAAAIATTQLVMQFRPRIVAMVGIAAGTHSGNKEFGDVLVADPSVDYNSGKVIQQGGIREFQPDPYPIGLNPRLRSVLQKYHSTHPVFDKIRNNWPKRRPARANRLHLGPLGAADQVIDDPTRITEIQKNWRKLIGVEMETYAVYRACHESPEPKPRYVSFKSVCDFAAEKTDSWQEYAAFVAAEFAVEFFKAEWDALWPPVPT